jgi:hypothetical protein
MVKIRRQLRPHGMEIGTVSDGYVIEAHTRVGLAALMDASRNWWTDVLPRVRAGRADIQSQKGS